jgi:hypothetical protein
VVKLLTAQTKLMVNASNYLPVIYNESQIPTESLSFDFLDADDADLPESFNPSIRVQNG